MKLRDNTDLQLKIKSSIDELERWLNEFDFWIKENREKISLLIDNIILFEWKITDNWEKHDYVNWTLFLKQIKWDIDNIWKDKALKYFADWEERLKNLAEVKNNFSINEIKNLLVWLSKMNNIDIDIIINDEISTRKIEIVNWEVINADLSLFQWWKFLSIEENNSKKIINKIWSKIKSIIQWKDCSFNINYDNLKLKNVYPDINFELWRLFQNLISNSKEAWADKLSVCFSVWFTNLIIKYLDNWSWMDDDIILNKMFMEWESTKKDSWKNLWEWMHWIVELLNEKWIDLDIYSQTDEWYFAKWFMSESFSQVLEWGWFKYWYVDLNSEEYYWKNWKFPNETWTEFIFKFPVDNNDSK